MALKGANSEALKVTGTTCVEFMCQGKSFKHSFYVVRGLLVPALLGMDFLQIHKAQLDCVNKTFTIQAIRDE